MTFKTIMVQLNLEEAAAPRLKFGWELAQRLEADMIAFAAAESSFIVPVGDDGVAAAEVMRLQNEEIKARLKTLEQEFQGVTGDDPRASWRGHLGDTTRLLALHSRSADLVVAGPPLPGASSNFRGGLDTGALILSTGRPVLLVSESLVPVREESVVVAWKDTREARRAVVDAMPFLTRAKQVAVVAVEADKAAVELSVADVVGFLAKHGVNAHAVVINVEFKVGDALAEVAAETGANLLVAGGYGHSRLSEWAFGGVTRSLLSETGLHRLFSN